MRVVIDYVCRFVQCICPLWMLDINGNNENWYKINEINIKKNQNSENKIKYFDVC